ncbi:MAG: TonB-dependent receptor [Chitinophagales bacterium]|nr:TonB-dependent receptor [Chitinophagales bacterium]
MAQKATMSGYVLEKSSGEPLIGANIILSDGASGASTNQFGFYQLIVVRGRVSLIASYVGFERDTISFFISSDTSINFYLNVSSLHEIIIASEPISISPQFGIVTIPMMQIEKLPALMGETDIIKALTLTPGVSQGTEGTAGISVRGGSPDQNLVLLDGSTVYNTAHLFGFLSIFNPDAVKNVTLIKGGFPPKYGGRLSSIIDVTMKEGNKKKFGGKASIGLISSHLTFEGPIKKDTSSYIISVRTSYLGLLLLPTYFAFKKQTIDSYLNYWMYDVNFKANQRLKNGDQMFLSFYHGNDYLFTKNNDQPYTGKFKLIWGNETGAFRYTKIISSKLFSNYLFNYNHYRFSIKNFTEQESSSGSTSSDLFVATNASDISEITFKPDFDFSLPSQQLNFGAAVAYHWFHPNSLSLFENNSEITNIYPPGNDTLIQASSFAVYINDRVRFLKWYSLSLGGRAFTYLAKDSTYFFFEPRLSLGMNMKNGSEIELSYSVMNQTVHLLSGNGAGLPNDIWIPISTQMLPEHSEQFSIGYKTLLANTGLRFTLESYYKHMNNLINYKPGSITFFNTSQSWNELVETNGIGKMYGFEFLLEKPQGKWNGWIEYTLAWNYRQFSTLNNGNWFPSKYDNRHEFGIVINHDLSNAWLLTANWVFLSSRPVTLPDAIYLDPDGNYIYHYSSVNNERLPAYHRLDVALTKNLNTHRGNKSKLTIGMYNVYGRVNPFYLESQQSSIYKNGTEIGFVPYIESHTLFKFLPFASYSWKF